MLPDDQILILASTVSSAMQKVADAEAMFQVKQDALQQKYQEESGLMDEVNAARSALVDARAALEAGLAPDAGK